MKTSILFSAAMLLSIFTMAQNDFSQSRSSLPYHYIRITGEMNITLAQSSTPGVVVEGNAYQIGNTITMLRNDTLFVYQTNTRTGDDRTHVVINVNDLTMLEVSGKSKVDCSRLAPENPITVRALDGARIKIDVHAVKS